MNSMNNYKNKAIDKYIHDEEFKKSLGIKRVMLTLKASIPIGLKKKLKELVEKG